MFPLTGPVFQVWFLHPLRRIVSSGFVDVGTALRPLPQASHFPSLGCGCRAGCWEREGDEVLVVLSEEGPEERQAGLQEP